MSTSKKNGGDTTTPNDGVTVLRDRREGMAGDPEDLDLVHDVLSNQRRRQILHLLEAGPEDSAHVSELASTIAAWEQGIDDPETVSYDDRKSVQTTIYQHHAPKMAAAGLVEFDKRAGRVELDRQGTHIRVREDEGDADDVTGPASRAWRRPAVAGGIAASFVSVGATATIAGPVAGIAVLAVCVATALVTWQYPKI
jgi:DNA-binding transcriptional ArsR family regulator